jgi:hypothetical protein
MQSLGHELPTRLTGLQRPPRIVVSLDYAISGKPIVRICLIGSGSLALGLLYPWLSRLPGCDLTIVTRAGGEESEALRALKRYRLQMGGSELLQTVYQDVCAYDPRNLDDASADTCIACLQESDVIAVSVGVNNLPAAGRLIARACAGGKGLPLHLLAFENAPGASQKLLLHVYEEMEALGGGQGRALRAHTVLADRACQRDMDGERTVVIQAERFGEILLEETARDLFDEVISPEGPQPYVRYVPTEAVDLAERRKFWLVNGTHTALGLLCAHANLQLLNQGLSDERIAQILRTLHAEWVQVLHQVAMDKGFDTGLFSAEELTLQAERMFDRLRDSPDLSVRDVLKELTDLGEAKEVARFLHRLFQKLDDRLAEAVRLASEIGTVPVPFSSWMLATGVGVVRRHADAYLQN